MRKIASSIQKSQIEFLILYLNLKFSLWKRILVLNIDLLPLYSEPTKLKNISINFHTVGVSSIFLLYFLHLLHFFPTISRPVSQFGQERNWSKIFVCISFYKTRKSSIKKWNTYFTLKRKQKDFEFNTWIWQLTNDNCSQFIFADWAWIS